MKPQNMEQAVGQQVGQVFVLVYGEYVVVGRWLQVEVLQGVGRDKSERTPPATRASRHGRKEAPAMVR